MNEKLEEANWAKLNGEVQHSSQNEKLQEANWAKLNGEVHSTQVNLDLILREAETNRLNISVSPSGDADFKTIAEAINSIATPNTRRVVISIAPGLYREKLLIPSTLPFITFLGDTINKPKITGNAKASDIGSDGKPLKTYNTATVAVDAAYFIAMNIIFENTASPRIGSSKDQAVALRLSGDKCAVYNSEVYGFQDTLYDHKGLHYFKNCKIQGTVDFIFGDGKSLYEGCTIISIAQNSGFVTAQKREVLKGDTGFSILNSKVVGSGSVYLGRAWGNYSRVIFSYTYMDSLVLPEGWVDSMDNKDHHNLTVFYAEYKCSGPGSSFSRRPRWIRRLSFKDAQEFIGVQFIYGDTWLSPPL
ncbi:pectinesterase [Trifolium repens]|nr:pectinesterase [Trifolium repens]